MGADATFLTRRCFDYRSPRYLLSLHLTAGRVTDWSTDYQIPMMDLRLGVAPPSGLTSSSLALGVVQDP